MAVPIGELENAAALGWRAPEEERLGDWLLRAGSGFTGRANSALAVGDPGLPLAGAVEVVQRWYRARGLPPMIAVPYPLGRPRRSKLDRMLAGLGWQVRSGAATVMTATAAAVAGATGVAGRNGSPAAARIELDQEPDDGWLALYHYRGQELPQVARRLLMSAPWQAFASVREGGRAVAIGRVAAAAGWAGLTAVEVDPRRRRRGLATAVTAALAGAAAARGARRLYLQVENGNAAARALYARAGFAAHHSYHYRLDPAGAGFSPSVPSPCPPASGQRDGA